jgi:crossover junction endodeoxyribonuclease RuvC
VRQVVERYAPSCASAEIVFVNVNPQSTLLLGQARGAALAALVAAGLPVAEYTALQMKKAIVGHGQARKEQVQQMVMRLLALPGVPGPDAADALGLAIAHGQGDDAGAQGACPVQERPRLLRRRCSRSRLRGGSVLRPAPAAASLPSPPAAATNRSPRPSRAAAASRATARPTRSRP